jgi:probable F420-dependent oxidoreductase
MTVNAKTPTIRPFRFGVVPGASTASSWTEAARQIEWEGYSVLLSSDHLDLSGAHASMFSALPALAAAAAVTTDVRLGTSVINHDLHHPAVLAREALSVDVLSDGRLELGLGAGWAEYEYDWAGIEFGPVGRRIDRFTEYVEVVRALTRQPVTSHQGEYFRIDEMPLMPEPVQSAGPPIMIGGTGRRMLALAARESDIVGVNLNLEGSAALMDERISWIETAAAGRENAPEINTIVGTVAIGDGDRREILRQELDRLLDAGIDLKRGRSEDELLGSPAVLVGTVEQVVEDILSWRERWGVSYIITPYLESFAPVVARLAGS